MLLFYRMSFTPSKPTQLPRSIISFSQPSSTSHLFLIPHTQRHFQTCELCPDYYPGEEPDSSTIPRPELSNEWSGEFTLVSESTWEGGFCSTVSISNPASKAATDFLISLTLRNTQITTLWGLTIESNSQGKMTLKPDRSILIKPGEVSEDEMVLSI